MVSSLRRTQSAPAVTLEQLTLRPFAGKRSQSIDLQYTGKDLTKGNEVSASRLACAHIRCEDFPHSRSRRPHSADAINKIRANSKFDFIPMSNEELKK